MRKLLRKQGFAPETIVTDKLRSYGAAMRELGLSARQAAARRYVEHHAGTLVVVFSQHGRVSYTHRSASCPPLTLGKGSPLPQLPRTTSGPSPIEEAEPSDWLRRLGGGDVTIQVLPQRDARATILLHISDREDGEEDEAPEAQFPCTSLNKQGMDVPETRSHTTASATIQSHRTGDFGATHRNVAITGT